MQDGQGCTECAYRADGQLVLIPAYVKLGAAAIALAGAFTAGVKVSNWRHDSQQLAIEEDRQATAEALKTIIVDAVKGLRPKYTTIQNEVQRETRIEPRYLSADCEHTDAVWLRISAAYEALGYPPLDRTGVPPASPTSRPDAGSDR